MTRDEAHNLLARAAFGELEEPARSELEAYLREHPDLAAELADMRSAITRAQHELKTAPIPRLDPDRRAALFDEVEATAPPVTGSGARPLLVWAALAACLVVTALTGLMVLSDNASDDRQFAMSEAAPQVTPMTATPESPAEPDPAARRQEGATLAPSPSRASQRFEAAAVPADPDTPVASPGSPALMARTSDPQATQPQAEKSVIVMDDGAGAGAGAAGAGAASPGFAGEAAGQVSESGRAGDQESIEVDAMAAASAVEGLPELAPDAEDAQPQPAAGEPAIAVADAAPESAEPAAPEPVAAASEPAAEPMAMMTPSAAASRPAAPTAPGAAADETAATADTAREVNPLLPAPPAEDAPSPAVAAEARVTAAEAPREILDKFLFYQPVTLDLGDVPLREAISALQAQLRIPLQVDWSAMRELGIEPETQVRVWVKDVAGATVLTRLLDQAGADVQTKPIFAILERQVLVTSPSRLASLQEGLYDLDALPLPEAQAPATAGESGDTAPAAENDRDSDAP